MPDLREFLERHFAAVRGGMPFDEFMAAALYHADHGYYTTGIRGVGGRRSDFATAATLSDGLGRAVAEWIREEAGHHGWRGKIPLIEVGGGNGALAKSILKHLGWWRRRGFSYQLVEVSPILRKIQEERLGRSVRWWETVVEALQSTGGRALIFSNELVDAFPAKWLCQRDGVWREIWVRHDVQGLREEFRDVPPPVCAKEFSALALRDPAEGQRIEVHASYRDWLGEFAPAWKGGSMLTIDYGAATAAEVYHRRPGGTMRAYHRHERIEGSGIYARFGRQDLTCDVNFADLVAWGERLRWETVGLGSQAAFLSRFGVAGDPMADAGTGSAFQILEQRCREC